MAVSGPVEVELKLLVPECGRAALEQHPALQPPRATAPVVREEYTTYFDTPRLDLARNGFSLRIRRHGDERVQTLKSTRDGNGVAAARGEWEWSLAQDVPDLSFVAETPFGAEISAQAASGLQPVFETQVRRTVRNLRLDEDTIAEAALDEGRIRAGSAAQELREFELELKQGTTPGPLYRLALDLHATVPFTIGAESKAQRGLRLRTGEPPGPVESALPSLDGTAPALEAVRRVIGAELGHLVANQPAAIAGGVEGVHQMRIGIRRLRTVLALFGKHLEPHAMRRFEAELKRLGQVFGAARDWDVFCTQILPEAEQDEHARAWAALLRPQAEAERRAAHHDVEAEFERPAMTSLLLGLAAWMEPDEAGATAVGSSKLERPLHKLAPGLLDRMARRVSKRGGDTRQHTAEELHDLRKALKKLRYSADYAAALYPAKPVKHYQKAAKRLLKLLGAANDAVVATRLAERLCAGERSALAPAAGAIAQWSAERRAEALRKLPKAWKKFAAAPLFWR